MTQKPIFTEKGKSYRSDDMRYNFESGKARINKMITQEGEGFLHGEKIKKTGTSAFYDEFQGAKSFDMLNGWGTNRSGFTRR